MEDPPPPPSLARALEVLASGPRLALLRHLQSPRALREIELKADAGDGAPPRTFARQTIREHLDRLREIGVVVVREAQRPYGVTTEYLLNHQRIFALAEEFRALAEFRPVEDPGGATERRAEPGRPFRIEGPCLVLVRGLEEGRRFDLTPAVRRSAWVIGRHRTADVPLDFDPFVSGENALITFERGAYFLTDLPESRNGTTLNFQSLPRSETHPLGTGDIIGVGRSLLMFRS